MAERLWADTPLPHVPSFPLLRSPEKGVPTPQGERGLGGGESRGTGAAPPKAKAWCLLSNLEYFSPNLD